MLELARLAYLPALLEAEAFSDPSPHQRALRFAEFIGRAPQLFTDGLRHTNGDQLLLTLGREHTSR